MIHSDLLQRSTSVRLEAEKLLNELHLIEKLSRYGEVHLEGSFYLDVMLDAKDIDILVYNPRMKREDALECTIDIITSGMFDRTEFLDRVTHQRSNGMYGYCVQSSRDARDGWKVDIWFKDMFDAGHFATLERYKQRIASDESVRLAILEKKRERELQNLKIGGWDIYQNIIDDGAEAPQMVSVNS